MERFIVTLQNGKSLTSTEFSLVGAIDRVKRIKRGMTISIATEQGAYFLPPDRITSLSVEEGGPLPFADAEVCMDYDPMATYFTKDGTRYRYNDQLSTYEKQDLEEEQDWTPTALPAGAHFTRLEKVLFRRD